MANAIADSACLIQTETLPVHEGYDPQARKKAGQGIALSRH